MSDQDFKLALGFLRERNTNFPQKPKVIDDIEIFEMPDGLGFQFRGLPSPIVMRGELVDRSLPKLLPLLDGTKDVSEIIQTRSLDASAGELANLLMNLFMKGILGENDIQDKSFQSSSIVEKKRGLFWSRRLGITRFNHTASEIIAKLSRARVLLIADGLLGATVHGLLVSSGFDNLHLLNMNQEPEFLNHYGDTHPDTIDTVDGTTAVLTNLLKKIDNLELVIAAVRNVSSDFLHTINDVCVRNSVQWLRVQDNGSWLDCGPYVNPFDSPCYECMILRQLSVSDNAIEEELYQRSLYKRESQDKMYGESLSLASTAAAYIVQEAERIVTGVQQPFLGGKVVKFSNDGNIESSNFIRVPDCETCSRGGAIISLDNERAFNAN